MLIRWAVCVWLQCDSVLCEFTATFNLLASVIIIMFIINLGSFGWPISSLIRLEVLYNINFLILEYLNSKIISNFRLAISIIITYFMSCWVHSYMY